MKITDRAAWHSQHKQWTPNWMYSNVSTLYWSGESTGKYSGPEVDVPHDILDALIISPNYCPTRLWPCLYGKKWSRGPGSPSSPSYPWRANYSEFLYKSKRVFTWQRAVNLPGSPRQNIFSCKQAPCHPWVFHTVRLADDRSRRDGIFHGSTLCPSALEKTREGPCNTFRSWQGHKLFKSLCSQQ